MSESHVTPENTPSSSGRAADGKFTKGNQFGPGNPFARKCAAFRAALMEAVTEQDIKDIAVKLRDDAKVGDKAATKLLFQYVIGKPQPAVDPDTLDIHEMRTYLAATFPPEVMEEMQHGLPLALFLQLWPFFLFAKEQTSAGQFQQQVEKSDARQQRRAERTRQQAERRPQSSAAGASATPDGQEQSAPPGPSTNGKNGHSGPAHGEQPPSPNGSFGPLSMEMIRRWLRRHHGGGNGDQLS